MTEPKTGSMVSLSAEIRSDPETHRRVVDGVRKAMALFEPKVGDFVELRSVVRVTGVHPTGIQYEPVFEGGTTERIYVGPVRDDDPRLDCSELEDREFKPEGEDVNENLGRAYMIYQERITKLLEPFSDDQLKAFAGEVEKGATRKALDTLPRAAALTILMYRDLARRAKPIHDAGGRYCTTHDSDTRKCAYLHEDEDEDDY